MPGLHGRRRGAIAHLTHIDGLKLAVAHTPHSAAVALYLWFDVGAGDEPDELAGAAHLLEHMLFKGTPTRGPGEPAALVEGRGGDLNAWTSWDETCFHAVVDADAWEEALELLIDMTSRSLVDPEELERERQVVIDEIASYASDPEAVAADHCQALAFPDHPYGRPVLGTRDSVAAIQREALVAFWRRHYHPARATLAVAGPVDPDTVAAAVRSRIAHWRVGAPRDPSPLPGPPSLRPHEKVKKTFGGAAVHMAWRTPALGHPDIAALDVLSACLGQGNAAALPAALELEGGVATGTWSALTTYRAGGLLEVGFQVGDTVEAVARATEILHDVARHGFDGEEVLRAREGILCDLLFARESVDGQAADLAWNVARHGRPEAAREYRDRVAAVDASAVRAAAARWLPLEGRRTVVVDHTVEAAELRRALRPPATRRRPPSTTPWTDVRVKGLRVVVLPDESELAAIRLVGVGGQLLEVPRTAGLSRAWASAITRGAGPHDALAFAARTDALAMVVEGVAGRSTMGVAASLPADRLPAGLELVADLLVEPHFDAVDVEHVVDELLDDLAALDDRPAQAAGDALWRALFPDHPWRLPPGGTKGSLARIRPATLRQHHAEITRREQLTLCVAGGVDPDRTLRDVESWVGELASGGAVSVSRPASDPRAHVPRVTAGREQAAVVLGVRGVDHLHPDRIALQFAAAILDSQSGRLFMSLREREALAYSVWASSDHGLVGGAFTVGITTDPGRIEQAEAGLRRELLRLADEGPTEEEVERTRRMLGGAQALRRERVAGRAADLVHAVHFGRPYPLDEVRAELAGVDARGVRDALRGLFPERALAAVARPA